MEWTKVSDDKGGTFIEVIAKKPDPTPATITIEELQSKLDLINSTIEKVNQEPDEITMSNLQKFEQLRFLTEQAETVTKTIDELKQVK
jgi:hypothetical protein